MVALIVGAIAAIAGMLVGFALRHASAKAELSASRGELAQARAESAARAGFEALAAERASAISQLNATCAELREELKTKADEVTGAAKAIAELNATLEGERKRLPETLQTLETAKGAFSDHFRALAGDVLKGERQTLSETNTAQIGPLLNSLKDDIKGFRDKVEQAQTDSKTGVATLQGLIGGLSNLNQELAEQAQNLTTALRGSAKAQGDWGEFILRDLLEKAGLREGEQFSFQQNFSVGDEDGHPARTVRTDVVVLLPGGRNLVIDSKLSLTAYTDYANAATDADRAAALKQHMASMRGHVVGLGKAGYHRLPGLETPDFVVMFVPVEPAFLVALQNDAELWADAYKQGILLVGPTTLLYIIRIVSVLWQQETQARNVKEVMDRGAKLYEKFAGFIADIDEIGKSLGNASACYEDARNKLSLGPGNLIKQVEMLRQLGVKPRKTLPAKLLETAGLEVVEVEEPGLALAAEAEGDGSL